MTSHRKMSISFGLFVVAIICQISDGTASPIGDQAQTLSREGRDNKLAVLDKINVDTYLRNTKAVNMQIKCVLKNGACDSVGKQIKRLIPMFLNDRNLCDECNANQTKKIRKIVDHLRDNYPEEWSEGIKQYGEPVGL